MAKFLTTYGTSYHIENVIIEAKKFIILVSPYLQISKTLYERLKDAANRGVNIKLIYGKDELKPNDKNSLAELPNFEFYFFENLHAKCYFNENGMVITSMNMYEFSEKNNREMGIFLTKMDDPDLYEKAKKETESIIQSSEIIEFNWTVRRFNIKNTESLAEKANSLPARGYCIRCEERIPFSMEKPYCFKCYSIWMRFENDQYEENVCHCCGEFQSATMAKPLCRKCFREHKIDLLSLNNS